MAHSKCCHARQAIKAVLRRVGRGKYETKARPGGARDSNPKQPKAAPNLAAVSAFLLLVVTAHRRAREHGFDLFYALSGNVLQRVVMGFHAVPDFDDDHA